ncbi:MAG: hypothetical protein WBE72_19195 [Terracidiphilus sp.]
MKDRPKPKPRHRAFRAFAVLFLASILGFLGWSSRVYVQIENYAGLDQAAPSDAIGVLGAAEYDGQPSPDFRARFGYIVDPEKVAFRRLRAAFGRGVALVGPEPSSRCV